MEILEPTGLELYKAIFSMKKLRLERLLHPPATRILFLQELFLDQDLDQEQTFGQTNQELKILQVVILIGL